MYGILKNVFHAFFFVITPIIVVILKKYIYIYVYVCKYRNENDLTGACDT